MKYNTASPFFFKNDINFILKQLKLILQGKGLLSMGRYVKKFEKNYSKFNGSKYSIVTSSGTAALEIILQSLKIGKNDEVILPSQTFIASATSIINVGAKPIFSEVDSNFLLDFEKFQNLINKKTKAVIIVHYCGLIHERINEIRKILKEKKIFLVEDASHAHGASIDKIKAGNFSDAAAFSLYSSKIITSGEGGIITTNNKSIYEKCSSIRSRGLDIKKDYEVYSNLGSNFRFTEVQALLALAQLKNIKIFISHRMKVAQSYDKILEQAVLQKKIRIINYSSNIIHPYWKYTVFLLKKQKRAKIKKEMNKKSIEIDWAYEPLVHLQPIMKKLYNNKKGMLPYSENLSKTHINFPTHYGINLKQATIIAKTFVKLV